MSSWAEERVDVRRPTEPENPATLVTIRYGDEIFYAEGPYEAVCQAIVEGWPLIVRRYPESTKQEKITFFGDVDWVSVDV